MTQRRLATIETVAAINPIPDADCIEAAQVRGWTVVVKRGEFVPGDRCLYIEIDALLDVTDPRFAFLAARGVRTDAAGVRGHVLKTARLRGVYSQGLALPVAVFPELADAEPGADVTELLGVTKWEPPIPASLAGEIWGMRPSWIPKTDEERVQNLPGILKYGSTDWLATEKIDGSSASIAIDPTAPKDRQRIACSRNLNLRESATNTMWMLAKRHDLHLAIEGTYPGLRAVVQGEVFGEGIQGNPLRMRGQHLRLFNVIVDGAPLGRPLWPSWALELAVPVLPWLTFPATVEQAIADVERLDSVIAPGRAAEGVVWRHLHESYLEVDGQRVPASWKVISNRYLLKHDR